MKGREAQLPGLSHPPIMLTSRKTNLQNICNPRIATIRPGMLGISLIAVLRFR